MLLLFVFIICISLLIYSYRYIISENIEITNIKFANGIEGGNYDNFNITLHSLLKSSSLINKSYSKVHTNGSLKNIELVNSYRATIGAAQEDLFYDSIKGINVFQNKNKMENLRFITAGYFEKVHFIVRKENDNINSFKDLMDTRVKTIIGVGDAGSGSEYNFIIMSLLHNVNPSIFGKEGQTIRKKPSNPKIVYKNGDLNTLLNQFFKNEIQGIYLVTGSNNNFINNLVKKIDVKFIDVTQNSDSLFIDNSFNKYYYKKYIDLSNYYKDTEEQGKIPTFGIRMILFTNDKTGDDIAYEVAKQFYQKNYEFRRNINYIDNKLYTNEYEPIDLAYSDELYTIHPGSRQFYIENNLISLTEKYKYDLDYYHDNVVKNYWKFPNIGIKSYNLMK
jgi:parallel beta-helix repeat protein